MYYTEVFTFTGISDHNVVFDRWHIREYGLSDDHKSLYYDAIKLNDAKIKLNSTGIMCSYLSGMNYHKEKYVLDPKMDYSS